MSIKHTPIYDRLIVRVLSQGERTAGGLYRPQMAIDNTPFLFAEVIAAGHGRVSSGTGEVIPLKVKDGDTVTFFRYSGGGEQLVFPDPDDPSKELMIIREPHVASIVTGLSSIVVETPTKGKLVLA